MTLIEIITNYCQQHGLSFRAFAEKSGVTSGYLSMLKTGVNPSTGKPISPTIATYTKIAECMGMTTTELFNVMDEAPIQFNTAEANDIQGENAPALDAQVQALEIGLRLLSLSPEHRARMLERLQVYEEEEREKPGGLD